MIPIGPMARRWPSTLVRPRPSRGLSNNVESEEKVATQTEIDPVAFRGALGSFATGVTIVTTHDADTDIGLTASSFNSVSLDPPMVLWSLSKNASSLPFFERSDHFAVHVLTEAQADLSARFATRGADKFAGLDFARGAANIPLLKNCSARFECRKAMEYEGGDHIIFVGEVIRFEHSPSRPLVFHGGRYATAEPKNEAPLHDWPEEGLAYWIAAAYFAWRAPALALSEKLGLSVAERRLLAALLENGRRSLGEINQTATSLDPPISVEVADSLCRRGLLLLDGDALVLSKSGRELIVSLVAARKAAEAAATLELGHEDSAALCKLLRDFVQASGARDDPQLSSQMSRFKHLETYLDGQG